MIAILVFLGLIVWGIFEFIKYLSERIENERWRVEDLEIRRKVKREQELAQINFEKYGWRPKEEMFASRWNQEESVDWEIEEDTIWWGEFCKSPEISDTYLKMIVIRNFGSEVYLITNYSRAEWYVEKLWIDKKDRYENFEDWSSCWKRKRSISKKFTSKKKSLNAIDSGDIWFENDLTHLEEVKAVAGTGELIHVKYWGGRRSGKPRYLTVLEVNCFDYEDEDNGVAWYAEVRERGARKDKTYRVDRMQLLPVNSADLVEDA